jgi:phosphatidylinositol alpha-1,6-mannosyltransferase
VENKLENELLVCRSAAMTDLLLLSSDYPPNDGGIARLCSEIAAGGARAGLEVQVIAPTPRNGIAQPPARTREVRVRHARPWREWDSYRALRSRICRGPVICGLWYPDGLLAQAAGARPRVILAHGSELMPSRSRWRRDIWGQALRSVCEAADLVVANSEYTLKLVLERAPGANALAIPLAVDDERFSPGDGEAAKRRFGVSSKVVLSTVSRLRAYKGHDVVLRAIAGSSADHRRKLVYLIAGKGPHRGELERQVAELGLSEQVRFLGFVPEDDLPDLYRASNLFLLCTREATERQEVEGFGLVFLEAQACGTPVVGTRTGGIPDAVKEGEGGWLIEQDDAAALSGLLSQLVDDPAAFLVAGRRARERVERQCTWEQYVRRLIGALESLEMPQRRAG